MSLEKQRVVVWDFIDELFNIKYKDNAEALKVLNDIKEWQNNIKIKVYDLQVFRTDKYTRRNGEEFLHGEGCGYEYDVILTNTDPEFLKLKYQMESDAFDKAHPHNPWEMDSTLRAHLLEEGEEEKIVEESPTDLIRQQTIITKVKITSSREI